MNGGESTAIFAPSAGVKHARPPGPRTTAIMRYWQKSIPRGTQLLMRTSRNLSVTEAGGISMNRVPA